MSNTNSEAVVIYRQTQTHKGHEFAVWSYLGDPDPEKSTMRFAFRLGGVTVEGLPDRAEAARQARGRMDNLPAVPVEVTPQEVDLPQESQEQQSPQQAELALA